MTVRRQLPGGYPGTNAGTLGIGEKIHHKSQQTEIIDMAKNTKAAHASMKAGIFEPGAVTKNELLASAECVKLGTKMESNTAKTLRHGTEMCDEAFRVFDAAFCRMSKREMEVEEATRKHVSTLKDKAGQVADALARIEKLGGADFEAKLQRLERFAAAVETLERLNKNGRLVDMVKAMAAIGA